MTQLFTLCIVTTISMSRSLSELDKYVQTVIPNDISRLEVHTAKMSRYCSEGENDLFREEERDAKSTLKNLKSNLKIVGNITGGLSVRDQREANQMIHPLKSRVQDAVHSFQVQPQLYDMYCMQGRRSWGGWGGPGRPTSQQ